MEQPLTPKSSQPKETPTTTTTTTSNNKIKMKRPPTPEEVLAHYESQGLESRAASLKAISDLQTLLFRSVASSSSSSSGRGKMDRLLADKLDNANTCLAILETKLDSKPSFPESIAIGVTSGAILHAISSAVPHLTRIWDSVNSATKTSH